MHTMQASRRALPAIALTLVQALACGSSAAPIPGSADAATDARGSELTGQACKAASECYPGVAGAADGGAFNGQAALCLDRVPGGYCTHLCATDADCCAVPGECRTGLKQVCAPFESTGQRMCFLSCEAADVAAAVAVVGPVAESGSGSKEDAYCRSYAAAALGCRSTGGGKDNRKVCLP